MDDNIYEKIIGTGVLYPITLSRNSNGKVGWYPVKGDKALITENINALLLYTIGERFRQEDFGTRLWECLEEPNTQAQAFLINTFLKESISDWEDRITYQYSSITRKDTKLYIRIYYTINKSNITSTLDAVYDNITNTIQ